MSRRNLGASPPTIFSLVLCGALAACSSDTNQSQTTTNTATEPAADPPAAVAATPGTAPATNECQASETWAAGFQADHCLLADGSNPPITPVYWPDVCTPEASAGWTPTQTSFDQLSWRSFLNTNWPAQSDGQPDTSQQIGTQADGAFALTVWEHFKSSDDLFGTDELAIACDANGPRVLTMTSKVTQEAMMAVEAHAELLGDPLSGIDQAFRGPLYPQGPDPLLPVYYEIRINDTEYNAIVAAGAQNKSPDQLNCTGSYKSDTCVPFSFPLDSTEVKAAWKVLSSDEVAGGTFYYQDLQIVDPVSGSCSVKPMGLVGLHIARKVSHSISNDDGGRKNSWAWSTFEHNNNVPPVGDSGAGGDYSFFNASCTPAVDGAVCAAATTPNPDESLQCCPNLYRYAAGTVPTSPTPDQVTRIDSAPPLTQACNDVYDPLDKGVFDNYNLVRTQWPKLSDGPPFTPTVTPAYSRNAVIETYFTKWQNGEQVNTSSCMGCHSGSSAVDMSYLFLNNTGT